MRNKKTSIKGGTPYGTPSLVVCNRSIYSVAALLIVSPKNSALANNLLVPNQNARKLGLSTKLMISPRQLLLTSVDTVLGITSRFSSEIYPLASGVSVSVTGAAK